MGNSLKYAVVLISVLSILQCSKGPLDQSRQPPRALSAAEENLVDSGNKFGFKLFREIVQAEPDRNIFISPLSVSMALGMAYNGADGTTLEAMDSTLELSGIDIQEVNESYQSLIDLLMGLDPEVTFQIANSMWYRQGFPVVRTFIDRIETYFYAVVDDLDFYDPASADIINDWVDQNTNGKITEIVDPPIDPFTVMFLINAIYFNANWTYQFDEEDTQEDLFTLPDGSQRACWMMFQEDEFRFLWHEDFQAVDLPYGDGLFSMTILLPRSHVDIDALIADLNQENWDIWINDFYEEPGALFLPKFSLEYEILLKDVLTALGMGIAFNPDLANFGQMIEPGGIVEGNLYITRVKHKTFIEVDEAGTEAAAVTSVGFGATSGPPVLRINRPFIFMIRENHSQTILFMGKIVEPTTG
ncbi:MAG: serpin family protein [candidate division Zixibacteria bacterium]